MEDKLEDLLLRERAFILQGKIGHLGSLTEQKAMLLKTIKSTPPTNAHRIERISEAATRNSQLLIAAGRGLKAAICQIGDATTQKNQSTYGPQRKRSTLFARSEKLEKKY